MAREAWEWRNDIKDRMRTSKTEKKERGISIAWRGNSSCCLPWDNIEMAACGTNRCSRYYKTRLNCERTAPRRWDYVDVLAWDRWIGARSLSFTCPRPRSARFSRGKAMQTAPRCEKKFQEQHVPEILGASAKYSSINFARDRQISRADCKGSSRVLNHFESIDGWREGDTRAIKIAYVCAWGRRGGALQVDQTSFWPRWLRLSDVTSNLP